MLKLKYWLTKWLISQGGPKLKYRLAKWLSSRSVQLVAHWGLSAFILWMHNKLAFSRELLENSTVEQVIQLDIISLGPGAHSPVLMRFLLWIGLIYFGLGIGVAAKNPVAMRFSLLLSYGVFSIPILLMALVIPVILFCPYGILFVFVAVPLSFVLWVFSVILVFGLRAALSHF